MAKSSASLSVLAIFLVLFLFASTEMKMAEGKCGWEKKIKCWDKCDWKCKHDWNAKYGECKWDHHHDVKYCYCYYGKC